MQLLQIVLLRHLPLTRVLLSILSQLQPGVVSIVLGVVFLAFNSFPVAAKRRDGWRRPPRGGHTYSFNSFPVAATGLRPGLRGAESLRPALSILSQLQQLLLLRLRQGHGQGDRRPFNSFPVAAVGREAEVGAVLALSILSQLQPPRRQAGRGGPPQVLSILSQLQRGRGGGGEGVWGGQVEVRPFNSFPVAAALNRIHN